MVKHNITYVAWMAHTLRMVYSGGFYRYSILSELRQCRLCWWV